MGYLVQRLAGMPDNNILNYILLPGNLTSSNLDIGSLPLSATRGLVHVDSGIG